MRKFIPCGRATVLGFTLACALVGNVQAEEPSPLHYLNIQTIHPQTRDAFLQAMRHNATQSRREDANIVFDVADPGGESPTVVLFESWQDRAGYLRHESSAHVAPVIALVPTSFAAPERKYLLENSPELPAPERKSINAPTVTHNVLDRAELKPEARSDFLQQAAASINTARRHPGNLAFNVYQEHGKPNSFVVYQRWTDTAAYQDYQASATAKDWNKLLQSPGTQARETLVLRDRILE